jgi:putative PEP-CTERM system TPR-repeat lipoprotein
VESLLADAGRHEAKGDWPAAVIQLKNVLQREPAHAEARFRLGVAYLRVGDARAAEKQFREALEAKYSPAAVVPVLAEALFQQGEFRKLLEATRSSDHGEIALRPEILSLRGHAQLSLDQPEAAGQSFDAALERDPRFPRALLGKARLAMQRRDATGALELVSQALANDARSLDGWLMKGDLERASNRADAAAQAYRRALEINPQSVAANFNLASLSIAAEQLDEAMPFIETIRRVAPNSALGDYLLGLVQYRRGNFTVAGDAVRRSLKNVPDHLPALALSGAIGYSLGAYEQAERELSQVLERAPASLYIRKLLAATLLKRGKAQQALIVLGPALRASPDDAAALALAAEAYYGKRDLENATRYFELAARKLPDDPGIRAGLGLARLSAGEVDRALTDLEAAARAGDGKAEMLLVASLLAAKKFDRARQVIFDLEKKRPRDPATHNLKGTVLLSQRDAAGARKAFERAMQLQPNFLAAAINLAQLDLRENNPQAARARYETLLQRESSNVEIMIALARLADATGARAEAVAWLERAKARQPQSFSVSLALARQHFAAGDYGKAAAAARDALLVQGENAEALDLLGHSQLREGKGLEARTTYTKLVALYPKSPHAYYGLSAALAVTGSQAAAEGALRNALELKPDFPEALGSLAALQLRAGKFADALKTAEQLKKRYPRLSLGPALEGDAHMAARKFGAAVRAYDVAFRLERSAALLIKLHSALRASNRGKEGNALLQDWLGRRPDDSRIRLYYADASIKEGNYALAAEHYEIERRKQPENLGLLHNLLWCYEQLGQYPRALEIAEIAYKVDSNRVVVLDDLARLLLKSDADADRATVLLEKALTLAPESQSVRYHLSQAYLKKGDKGRARLALEQLLRSRQPFPEQAAAAELLKQLQR